MKIGRTVKVNFNKASKPINVTLMGGKKEDLLKVIEQLGRYNSLSVIPFVQEVPGDREEALCRFVKSYGDAFYKAIKTPNKMVFQGNNLLNCCLFLPEERAVFVLNKRGFDGEEGAKIFLDEDHYPVKIEQKKEVWMTRYALHRSWI